MIEIQKKNGEVDSMSLDEFSRWMCLVEAFHFIEQKSSEMKIDITKMIKPLAIEAYVKERYDSMRHDVECEYKLGNI